LLWNSAPADRRRRPLEQRQRLGKPAALVQNDTEVMRRCGVGRCDLQRRAIIAFRVIELAALMRRERVTHQRVRIR
jgi:hypothetical protein